MTVELLKDQAERCRWLAGQADDITKARLLNLAAEYDERIAAIERSEQFRPSRKQPAFWNSNRPE